MGSNEGLKDCGSDVAGGTDTSASPGQYSSSHDDIVSSDGTHNRTRGAIIMSCRFDRGGPIQPESEISRGQRYCKTDDETWKSSSPTRSISCWGVHSGHIFNKSDSTHTYFGKDMNKAGGGALLTQHSVTDCTPSNHMAMVEIAKTRPGGLHCM